MLRLKFVLLILLPLLLLVLLPNSVFAIDDPSEISFVSARGYQSTPLEDNDILIIMEFNVDYPTSSVPTISIQDAFICTLTDLDGITPLKTKTIYESNLSNIENGYGRNVCSIYLSADEVSEYEAICGCILYANTLNMAQIRGLPTYFVTPPTEELPISWQSNVLTKLRIEQHVAFNTDSHAETVGETWEQDLTTVSGSKRILNTNGEVYFTQVIDNLVTIAPGIFETVTQDPNYFYQSDSEELPFTQDYLNSLLGNIDSSLNDSLEEAATNWGVESIMIKTSLTLAAAGLIFMVSMKTLPQDKGTEIALLGFMVIITGAMYGGMLHLQFGVAILVISALGIVYQMVWKSAG